MIDDGLYVFLVKMIRIFMPAMTLKAMILFRHFANCLCGKQLVNLMSLYPRSYSCEVLFQETELSYFMI
jgi:hypothetical protein